MRNFPLRRRTSQFCSNVLPVSRKQMRKIWVIFISCDRRNCRDTQHFLGCSESLTAAYKLHVFVVSRSSSRLSHLDLEVTGRAQFIVLPSIIKHFLVTVSAETISICSTLSPCARQTDRGAFSFQSLPVEATTLSLQRLLRYSYKVAARVDERLVRQTQ